MEFYSVSSSNLQAVGFDEEAATLGVRYKNGTEYIYLGVPKSVFERLLTAQSPGTFLNNEIKKRGHKYQRVR
jgi:hypothetical protein